MAVCLYTGYLLDVGGASQQGGRQPETASLSNYPGPSKASSPLAERVLKVATRPWYRSGNEEEAAYGEEGVDDVCLDGAQRFVSDDDEDLLLLLQVDEVSEPGLLGQSEGTRWSHDPGQLMADE